MIKEIKVNKDNKKEIEKELCFELDNDVNCIYILDQSCRIGFKHDDNCYTVIGGAFIKEGKYKNYEDMVTDLYNGL